MLELLERHRISTMSLALGLLFFAASLTPSMIPKSAVQHGLIGGVSIALGYLLAVTLIGIWRYLQLPETRSGRTIGQWALLLIGLTGLVWGLVIHRPGQNEIRSIMGMGALEPTHEVVLLVLGAVIFGVLFVIGRAVANITQRVIQRLTTFVPPRVAVIVSLTIVAMMSWYLSNGVVLRWTINTLDAGLREVDARIDPDTPPPSSPLRAGSNASLIPWDTLGARGRGFVAGGKTPAQIAAFHGGVPTQDPIRIYAGLNSADTIAARAHLVLDEMIRTKAFDRSVVVVVTPTGTGWIDEAAVDPLEVLHRGDTAIVGLQYSYLLSPLALFVEPDVVPASAEALAQAVHGYWSNLPEATRPKLYLHGLSLGSYGSEQAFSLINLMGEPIDGALWSGPTFDNVLWRQLTQNRNPGSLVWLPNIGDGRTVRFTTQQNALDVPNQPWSQRRLVYLQYPSDPITFFEIESAIRPSQWMVEERGPDVSDEISWYPIITMLQLMIDMPASSDVPAGFGHHFAAEHYIDAWIALTEPKDWTDAETERLKDAFRERQ